MKTIVALSLALIVVALSPRLIAEADTKSEKVSSLDALLTSLEQRIAKASTYDAALHKQLKAYLTASPAKPGSIGLEQDCRAFVDGKIPEHVFVGYLRHTLGTDAASTKLSLLPAFINGIYEFKVPFSDDSVLLVARPDGQGEVRVQYQANVTWKQEGNAIIITTKPPHVEEDSEKQPPAYIHKISVDEKGNITFAQIAPKQQIMPTLTAKRLGDATAPPSDEALKQKLLGTWWSRAVRDPQPWQTPWGYLAREELKADGTYQLTMVSVEGRMCRTEIETGTWTVKDGKVMYTPKTYTSPVPSVGDETDPEPWEGQVLSVSNAMRIVDWQGDFTVDVIEPKRSEFPPLPENIINVNAAKGDEILAAMQSIPNDERYPEGDAGYYLLAAQRGSVRGMELIAAMYDQGIHEYYEDGLKPAGEILHKPDANKARAWYKKAAEKGSEVARQWLKENGS